MKGRFCVFSNQTTNMFCFLLLFISSTDSLIYTEWLLCENGNFISSYFSLTSFVKSKTSAEQLKSKYDSTLPPFSPSDTLFWQHMAKQHKNPEHAPILDSPWNAAAPCKESTCYLPHNTRGGLIWITPRGGCHFTSPTWVIGAHSARFASTSPWIGGGDAVSINGSWTLTAPHPYPVNYIRASQRKPLSDLEFFL